MVQIRNNTIHHSTYGLYVEAKAVEAVSNTIHSNNVAVFALGETAGLRMSANSIYSNHPSADGLLSGMGIDLDPTGPTFNDAGDLDSGPNGLLNFPILNLSAASGSGDLRIRGTYDGSLGIHTYRLEFFANRVCDPTGYGEGRTFLGSADVTTNVAGRATFDVTISHAGVLPDQWITSTAIDLDNNTSEFSHCVEVRPGDSLSAAAGAGATELHLGNTGAFRVGDLIRLNPGGGNQEDNQVTGFGSLLLVTPLKFEHAAGEPVVVMPRYIYLPQVIG